MEEQEIKADSTKCYPEKYLGVRQVSSNQGERYVFLPKNSGGDEDDPKVAEAERGGVHDHPHQRHEVHGQGGLPAKETRGGASHTGST